MREIIIENAVENNLKGVSLRIPHYRLIVVTGVSGSGKTSLVHDVLVAEGQRLFLENFSGGRLMQARLSRPKASRIGGLFPVISIGQNTGNRSPRSTVGTLTEIYDLLRLLFARLGRAEDPGLRPFRSLFSFNLPDGYCPACKGLGVRDHIDPGLLIGDPSKTIREGAFVLTTPNNYIVYSQVTMDVLDQVCRAEGFSVDIPWRDLTDEQKRVVLYGSDRIKVLFGKHPLESRLKWTGITAKPREEDYYKGILTVMEDILRRERNPNIMRFARSLTCTQCGGKRLNERALSVKFRGQDISKFSDMTVREIRHYFQQLPSDDPQSAITGPIREVILKRTDLLIKLGAGHLTLNRESATLSGGELRRLRLANHAAAGMRNILYILDEPTAGLHPSEHRDLLEVLRSLVAAGNTVLLVDHDEQSIREADWIVDIGPGAGSAGGHILFNGPGKEFFTHPQPQSLTWKYLHTHTQTHTQTHLTHTHTLLTHLTHLRSGALNVITGVSGSGKTSLVAHLIGEITRQKSSGSAVFNRIIHVDSSPIGRTPKSNPATYTGLSDHVRDLLASLPESRQRGYKKGQFSFVVRGGRCESCGGAGVQQIGMHFLGNVEVVCEVCEGRRFTPETLEIKYQGLNIFEILELTVDEAHTFFSGNKKITAFTSILSELGLGYLKLGQPSTTLSGGEAQRVKLATELARQSGGKTLYVLDEPTTGLHMADVEVLLKALGKLTAKGHTLLCKENDPAFILRSDWVVDLGPGSGREGGRIVMEGPVDELVSHPESITAAEVRSFLARYETAERTSRLPCSAETIESPIRLTGVETNNLKNIDVEFPVGRITAVTGVSGSGKSSLVYGTLYAESQRLFLEGMPAYSRQFATKTGAPELRGSHGLVPAIALQKKNPVKNPRSTIATYTGLYDLYRLLFSRLADHGAGQKQVLSTAFSFNTEEGACPACKGLGSITACDPARLMTHPDRPLTAGALDGTKTGLFYGDPYGQYIAALVTAGIHKGVDFTTPYRDLDDRARGLALEGCGDEMFDVAWKYKRGTREGVHKLTTTWPGFLKLVENEYARKHADARGEAMLGLMKNIPCGSCHGYRLKPEMLDYRVNGLHIGELTAMPAGEAADWFSEFFNGSFVSELASKAAPAFREGITGRLDALQKAGLGYISTDRIIGTLSGGEFQRLQLAGLVRAPLHGAAYILDEPSFGLHPSDAQKIADLVLDLNRHGNSVILVDYSPLLLEKSDFLIEMGPGAGNDGGKVVYAGKSEDKRRKIKEAIETGEGGKNRTAVGVKPGLVIRGACANNLQNIDIDIPGGILTVITGVSGSGKTSLLDRVIHESHVAGRPVNCSDLSGFWNFSGLVYVEQPLPGKGHTATAGSFLGIPEVIAKLYASSAESRSKGFKSGHFIPGSKEGRCPACEGTGTSQVSLDFFSDAITPCERCNGTGFRDEVLEITIGSISIHETLRIPFASLAGWIGTEPAGKGHHQVVKTIGLTVKTGIGHLSAGRSLATLSTGELQRLKLVSGLSGLPGGNCLFLLDEPTGGLHPNDVIRLVELFDELVREGHTLVCVTHDPLLIAAAGRIIELGPGGGARGGRIV